ncbi:hypothetical protein [Defluviimonas sp. SAOS-178_SWC]
MNVTAMTAVPVALDSEDARLGELTIQDPAPWQAIKDVTEELAQICEGPS